MKNVHIFSIRLKNCIIPLIFVLFTLCLIIFSNKNLIAAKNGLKLFANAVVPSLLPFFIATELLSYTNIVYYLGNILNRFMRPLFNVPGIGAFSFIMGIISGYPTGAKIVTNFRNDNLCTKEEAERMLAFTNNSGPLFIIGTVGISLFGDTRTGILLFITHILACISVGIIFRFWKYNSSTNSSYNKKQINNSNKNCSFSNLGEILGNSISSAISTVVMIGGFVVLFSVVISILKESKILELASFVLYPISDLLNISRTFCEAFLTGLVELTNGVQSVALIPNQLISINVIICAFLLGFGGFSVLLQVFSIISKSDISIKAYFIGKLLQGTLAAFYTFAILKYTNFFNLDIVTTFSNISTSVKLYEFNPLCLVPLAIGLLFIILIYKHLKRNKIYVR
mgnify:CR=1 FL=1